MKHGSEGTIKRFLKSINNRTQNFNDEISKIHFIKYVLERINKNYIVKSEDFKNYIVQAKNNNYNNLIGLEDFVSKYINND